MLRTVIGSLVLSLLLLTPPAMAGQADKEKAAVAAAEKWLALVDGGKYAASWDAAAGYFRNAVSPGQWDQSLTAVRKPLGRVLSRKVAGKTFATSLPGAPDGEYVVIRFTTSFERKKAAVETVTPMLDEGGQWRVSGYFIK